MEELNSKEKELDDLLVNISQIMRTQAQANPLLRINVSIDKKSSEYQTISTLVQDPDVDLSKKTNAIIVNERGGGTRSNVTLYEAVVYYTGHDRLILENIIKNPNLKINKFRFNILLDVYPYADISYLLSRGDIDVNRLESSGRTTLHYMLKDIYDVLFHRKPYDMGIANFKKLLRDPRVNLNTMVQWDPYRPDTASLLEDSIMPTSTTKELRQLIKDRRNASTILGEVGLMTGTEKNKMVYRDVVDPNTNQPSKQLVPLPKAPELPQSALSNIKSFLLGNPNPRTKEYQEEYNQRINQKVDRSIEQQRIAAENTGSSSSNVNTGSSATNRGGRKTYRKPTSARYLRFGKTRSSKRAQ